jgi:mono/diheme cytochrome c family protein
VNRGTKAVLIIVGLLFVGALLVFWSFTKNGFSARDEPGALEAFFARRVRTLSIPRGAREARNPVPFSQEVLAEAKEHFADHCATCHGNDGRGDTSIGRNLHPKPPDMQLEETQSLSDGELFYFIHNGIRLSGMPAWGPESPDDDVDSWKLVHFIRHLPDITVEELEQMRLMNPVSRQELEQEEEERRFLEGAEPAPPAPRHEH